MTHFKQLSEVLRNYYDIPDQELDKINGLFYPYKLKKGEFFVRSGYMSDSIGFIVTGLLRYFYTDKNGVEYTKALEKVYIIKQMREIELLLEDAQSRYIHFLDQYPMLHKRLKQHYIASYLGISPVSLSRIRRKMSNY